MAKRKAVRVKDSPLEYNGLLSAMAALGGHHSKAGKHIDDVDDGPVFSVEIGHRWLVHRKPCEPEWIDRSLVLFSSKVLRPLWRKSPVEGGVAQASAALTLLPLEHWDASMIPFVRSAGLSAISPPLLHCAALRDDAEK